MEDLFSYPHSPGSANVDTSILAAEKIKSTAANYRAKILEVLEYGDYSADQVADQLGVHWQSIRPRFTELKSTGQIIQLDQKVPSSMGGDQYVFRKATIGQERKRQEIGGASYGG